MTSPIEDHSILFDIFGTSMAKRIERKRNIEKTFFQNTLKLLRNFGHFFEKYLKI